MKKGKESKKDLFKDLKNDSTSSSSSSDSSTSSRGEEQVKLGINKKFAKEYENRKQREELRQLQQQQGDVDLDESSSSEEEDEDGHLLTNSVNVQFLKTIKALKSKDSSIYDSKTHFFQNVDENDQDSDVDEKKVKKTKQKKYKDLVREQIMERMDKDGASDDDNNSDDESTPQNSKLAYDAQQEQLRKAFLEETKNVADQDSDHDSDDGLMMVKKKHANLRKGAGDKELREEFEELDKIRKKAGKKQGPFNDPRGEVKDGEEFLLEYIKNKKWIDKDNDEMDHDDNDEGGKGDEDESSLEDIDRADDFEATYNFRFEQAAEETATSGAAFSLQTYARGQTMNTIRRPDTSRRDKRLARKERKAAERKAKEEQLKRLKNAKRQEMTQKLSQVKSVLSSVDENVVDEVAMMKLLEGDYDPEQFEKAMQAAYGDDFYQKEDSEWKNDMDVREALKDDDEAADVVGQDDVDGGMYDDNNEGDEDDDNGEGDWNEAANDPDASGDWHDEDDGEMEFDGEEGEQTTEIEKKIKEKMQDELYKLDYEDIIAGMPTRFKYRKVEANDYGLSTQEILLARDKTLKQFVSLKKMAPYKEDGEFQVGSRQRRRFREMLKRDLEEELTDEKPVKDEKSTEEAEAENDEPKKKKRRRLKKGKKKEKSSSSDTEGKTCGNEASEAATEMVTLGEKETPNGENDGKSKRRRNKKGGTAVDAEAPSSKTLPDFDGITSEGTPAPEKKKKKRKKGKKGVIADLPATRLSSYGL